MLHGDADFAVHSAKDLPRYAAGRARARRDAAARGSARRARASPPALRSRPPVGALAPRRRADRRHEQRRAARPSCGPSCWRAPVHPRSAATSIPASELDDGGTMRWSWRQPGCGDSAWATGSPPPCPSRSACRRPGRGSSPSRFAAATPKRERRCGRMHDPAAGVALEAERALVSALGGGCQLPLGGIAVHDAGRARHAGDRAVAGRRPGIAGARPAPRAVGDPEASAGSSRRISSRSGALDVLDEVRRAPMNMPCVYIVGAGPGDPSLISLRGRRFLKAADVVIYDHRVHHRLLRMARPDAERIDVGAAAPRPLDQDAICYPDRREGARGQDRRAAEVGRPVPVRQRRERRRCSSTSRASRSKWYRAFRPTIGGLAYAGVPITYPEAGDVVVLIRGHEAEADAPPGRRLGRAGAAAGHAGLLRRCPADRHDDEGAGRERPEPGGVGGAHLRRHAAVAAHRARAPWDDRGAADARQPRRCWSSDRSPACASTCAGSTHGRCSASASSSPDRASRPASSWRCSRIAAQKRSRRPPSGSCRPTTCAALDRACAAAGTFDWIVFTSANGVDHFMARLLAIGDVRELQACASARSGRPPPPA